MPDIYDEEIDIDESAADDGQGANEAAKKGEENAKKEPQKQASETVKENRGITLSEDEYADFKRAQHDRVLAQIEAEFKKEYPDFNMEDIKAHILKVAETDPQKAESLLNKNGIENIYLKHFRGKSRDDEPEFDTARGIGGGGESRSEMARRINKGEISQEEKLAYLSKIF